ncbi:hypothetical protein M0813_27320 [Anaeramoeba flamelloides]|uniref:Uncharacterized protein n=1 Tax=Anaeramoeba flamelloides TaxID=1746091 RepID=A0ABQ8XVF1_9EUKA|nr:hypothetical protein M0813_27320 [Anaeramoeba flamelloides]
MIGSTEDGPNPPSGFDIIQPVLQYGSTPETVLPKHTKQHTKGNLTYIHTQSKHTMTYPYTYQQLLQILSKGTKTSLE